uniref:Uncharacterized protein n=1 Tax=Laticauda laticaudata TaxID=8630 RepID=A0A8C5RLX5_LATLA
KNYNYLPEAELEEEIVKGNIIAWSRNIGCSITLIEWEKVWSRNNKIPKSIEFKPELFLLGIFKKQFSQKVKYTIVHILTKQPHVPSKGNDNSKNIKLCRDGQINFGIKRKRYINVL